MEVRPGYKQTEVGVIPLDWDVVPVGKLARFTSGKGISVAALHAKSSDFPVPVYGGNGIAGYTTTAIVNAPCVVVGRVGQKCGEVYLTDGPAWITDNALYPKDIYRLFDELFLACSLKAVRLNEVKNKNDLPLVTQAILAAVKIAWPAIEEQRAIATALSDVDALLAKHDQFIAKKRDLKQAAMQQLLTGQTRLSGYSGKWEVKRLGDVGEISGSGVDKKIRPDESPVRLVNYMDVYRRAFIFSGDLDHWVTASPNQARRCAVQKGDVFFTPSSETRDDIANSAVAMEDIGDATYSYHVVRLRLKEPWDLRFRTYAFKTRAFLNQAETLCDGGGTRYVISLGKFRRLTINVPPLPEQTAIATVLSDMDTELDALEARRDKTRALKQGMMQELLTGRIRLV